MEIEIRNAVDLFFPNPNFQQVYFEAIANALDAGAADIQIYVKLRSFSAPESLRLVITDNGEGFTDARFERFAKLLMPEDSYHKGLGRLVFLRYFQQVEVESSYDSVRRTFSFTGTFDGTCKTEPQKKNKRETRLTFQNFAGKSLKSYDDVRASSVVERLKLEMLPQLYEMKKSGRTLKITVSVEIQEGNPAQDFFSDTQSFSLDSLPELTEVKIADPALDMFDGIAAAYRIEQRFGKSSVMTVASVDGRTIPLDLIPPDAIPNGYSVIFLFTSKLFKADSSRQRLEMKDEGLEKLLFKVLRRHVAEVINEQIPAVKQKNQATKDRLVERYPHLVGYFEEETVGLIQKEEALDIAQKRFFKDQKEILEATELDNAQFEKSLDISARTLTEYVLYRSLIIKKLRALSEDDLEAKVHDLIVPRGSLLSGHEIVENLYSNNAWLLDDKFMSFRTILSEAEMKKVVAAITLSSTENQQAGETRPDISMIFSADPANVGNVDVVIVEVKRKRDNDKENTFAAVQLLQRARKLIDFCPNIQRAWYFGIIKINDELEQFLRDDAWTPLYSKGKCFYRDRMLERPGHPPVPVPLCLLSFDAVVEDAAARNHTFLEILRSEIVDKNKHAE